MPQHIHSYKFEWWWAAVTLDNECKTSRDSLLKVLLLIASLTQLSVINLPHFLCVVRVQLDLFGSQAQENASFERFLGSRSESKVVLLSLE